MRKPLVVLVLFLFLAAGVGAAELLEPADDVYDEDPFIPVMVNHSFEPDNVSYTLGDGEFPCDCYRTPEQVTFPQGNTTLMVYVKNGSVTYNLTTWVYVDSKDPKVTSIMPEGTIFDLRPRIEAAYEDAVSGVNLSRVRVTLNGNDTTAAGTVKQDGFTYRPGSALSEGSYTVSVTVYDTVGNKETEDVTFTLPTEPVLSEWGVNGTVATRTPELTVRARDPSGIDIADSSFTVEGVSEETLDFSMTVDGDDIAGDDGDEDVTLTYDGLSLPADGRYEVVVDVEDDSADEHSEEHDWTFTVDTTPPVIDDIPHNDGEVISGEEAVRVRGHDELGDVTEASFSLGGEKAVDRNDDAGGWFSGTLNTHRVEEGFQQLLVSLWDDAGNVVPPRAINVTVDNTPPQFTSSLTVYPKTAATHVRVTGVVEDKAAGIEEVTYTVNGSDVDGDLEAVDGAFDARTEAFEGLVDASRLSAGQHTLYVRAVDAAGHRSAKAGATFTVAEDASAALIFDDPADVQVERGKEVAATVAVKNTGDVAEYVELDASSERNVTVKTEARRIDPGETKRFQVTVVGGREAGTFPLTLTADGLATSTEWTGAVIVQPRPAEQERIRDRFEALRERFEEANASRTTYDLEADTLDAQLSSAGSAVAEIERLLEQGRYRAAEQRLDETERLIGGTETTLTGQMTRYRVGQAASLLVHLVLFAVVAFATVFGYRAYRVDEDSFGPKQDGTEKLRQQLQRLTDRFQRDDEESKPAGWDGFS